MDSDIIFVNNNPNHLRKMIRGKWAKYVLIFSLILSVVILVLFYTNRQSICKEYNFEVLEIKKFINVSEIIIDTNLGNITMKLEQPNNCELLLFLDTPGLAFNNSDKNLKLSEDNKPPTQIDLPSTFEPGDLIFESEKRNITFVTEPSVYVSNGNVIGKFEFDSIISNFLRVQRNYELIEDRIEIIRIIPIR